MVGAMSVDGLKGEETTVFQLFGKTDDRFRAPEFQRHYVWRTGTADSEVDKLWSDFDSLLDEEDADTGDGSLFLGALVLQVLDPGPPGTGVLYSIIDGQQRITTLFLILVAIAEAYQRAGEVDEARYLISECLLARSPKVQGYPRVEPTVSDRGVMARVLSCLNDPAPNTGWQSSSSSDDRLEKAWTAIRNEIDNRSKNDLMPETIDVEKLTRLRDRILHNLELVTITLGSKHNPHEVYERLNTRGRSLTEIDLVRNTVFFTAGDDPNTAQTIYDHHWNPFESQLGDKADAYWFPYAVTRVPSTTRAKSYRDLHDYWMLQITNKEQGIIPAKGIVDDLREFIDGFRAVAGVSSNSDSTFAPEVWNAILRLRRMDVPSIMYPFLMQLLQGYLKGNVSGEDVIGCIGVVDSFMVRRMFMGLANQGIHAVFKSIWNNTSADLPGFEEALLNRTIKFPDDAEFEEGIRTLSLYNVKKSKQRYVLSEYEGSVQKGDPTYPLPDDVTVDHLLPQGAEGAEWPGFSSEDRATMIHTWANLVPLSAKGQAQKGAKSWQQQRKLMIDQYGAAYKSTLEVFHTWPSEWTLQSWNERCDHLVSWALERWPRNG